MYSRGVNAIIFPTIGCLPISVAVLLVFSMTESGHKGPAPCGQGERGTYDICSFLGARCRLVDAWKNYCKLCVGRE